MKGWSGTIVWIDWEGTCRIWNELLSLRTKEEWISWYKENGSLILDGVDSESTPPWRPTLANKVIHAQRSELTVYDEAKVLRTWTRRDFLINKRVMVVGAHECKGMKGWVVDVNVALRNANVSLDARTMVSNKPVTIGLANLMLDLSKDK